MSEKDPYGTKRKNENTENEAMSDTNMRDQEIKGTMTTGNDQTNTKNMTRKTNTIGAMNKDDNEEEEENQ